MSEQREMVLKAPIGRAIVSLAWPIAFSNELSILTISVLVFWLGRLIGDTGQVVESLFRPFSLMVYWFFASTSVGASVLVSRSVGAADGRGLSIISGAVTLTLAMWAVLVAVALPFSPWLAGVLAGDLPVDQPMLEFFLGWLLVGLPALSIAEILLDAANATGATRFNLVRVVVDLSVMAVMVPLLMTLMGISGGPVAKGVALVGLGGVLWLAMIRRRTKLGLGERGTSSWRMRWALWKDLLSIGLPMQVGRIAIFAAQMGLVRLVMRDGAPSVAGFGIAMALMLFGATATLSLGQAGAILVGQSLGAGLRDRARRGIRVTLLAGWLSAALFVVATLFAGPVIDLFTSDPAIAEAAGRALSILRWASFGVATWQVLIACFAAHRATVRASALLVGAEAFGLVVAFSLSGSYLDAVCIAFVAANGLKAALLFGLLLSGTIERARAPGP